jgi:hypothetical protein
MRSNAVTSDAGQVKEGREGFQGGKMGRARSFAAAQDDGVDGGPDNRTPA